LPVLLGIAAAATVAERDARAGTLLYGHVYTLVNAADGGYLDTRGSGCQGNASCVSTATSPNRASGSGAWQILPVNGQAMGSAVPSADSIHLENLSQGFGGFLDTRGSGCQNDDLCVSTSSSADRDNGSGTWAAVLSDAMGLPVVTTSALTEGKPVLLENGYAG